MSDDILCVGELLWDALPDGLFLGGAPFNVASHLNALGQEVAVASRVGDDRLGTEALRRMRARGLDTGLTPVDDTLPTGFVRVGLDGTSEPDYDILAPAAWDALPYSDSLRRYADRADALVYGSLAQRAPTSRRTIRRLWEADLLRVFDVNLRPPFDDRAVVEASLRAADVVKCNDGELRRLQDWFDLPGDPGRGAATVIDTFDCAALCVTSGEEGSRLWMGGDSWHHPGYTVDVEDPVGAGDAFLAALLAGLLGGETAPTLLDHANRLGAYVASRSGALPSHPADAFREISALGLDP